MLKSADLASLLVSVSWSIHCLAVVLKSADLASLLVSVSWSIHCLALVLKSADLASLPLPVKSPGSLFSSLSAVKISPSTVYGEFTVVAVLQRSYRGGASNSQLSFAVVTATSAVSLVKISPVDAAEWSTVINTSMFSDSDIFRL